MLKKAQSFIEGFELHFCQQLGSVKIMLKRPKELWSNPDKYKLKTDFTFDFVGQ